MILLHDDVRSADDCGLTWPKVVGLLLSCGGGVGGVGNHE